MGLLTLELRIAHSQSLKDKRQVLRSLKDRLRRRFNISVAEVGFQDTWQRSLVGVATVSGDRTQAEGTLESCRRGGPRCSSGMILWARNATISNACKKVHEARESLTRSRGT